MRGGGSEGERETRVGAGPGGAGGDRDKLQTKTAHGCSSTRRFEERPKLCNQRKKKLRHHFARPVDDWLSTMYRSLHKYYKARASCV